VKLTEEEQVRLLELAEAQQVTIPRLLVARATFARRRRPNGRFGGWLCGSESVIAPRVPTSFGCLKPSAAIAGGGENRTKRSARPGPKAHLAQLSV